MPQRNQIKDYRSDAYYHVYNRGAYKEKVFRSNGDYFMFRLKTRKLLEKTNNIRISAFSLLPNHFHLYLWQKNARDITKFMSSLLTSYGLYFSRKYNHSGRLFEGPYKARLLKTPEEKDQVRIYILDNPIVAYFDDWKHVGVKI